MKTVINLLCVLSVAFSLMINVVFVLENVYYDQYGLGSLLRKTPEPSSPDLPPYNINIRGERWAVWPHLYRDGSTMGETYCNQRIIYYDPIESQSQIRETLWHELGHAQYCYQGLRMANNANWAEYTKDHAEHEIVYQMGMFMPFFIRDNPDFVKWTMEGK